MALELGTLLNNRYRIERVLGQGGFGAVYLAVDQDLGIPCALKENLNASPQAERQFRREATLLAGLRHTHLPRVTDHFILAGHQYLVMDYIEGDDLRQRLEALGALPQSDALRWTLELCDALTYLHTHQPPVIHRDIKPGNIKITPGGEAVLVDFGIAKLAEAGQKTTTGAAALTSGYAPPEQYQLGATDGRTDEYALAATLYHLLTGRIPPDSVERLIGQAALTPPEDLRPDLAPNVAAALQRALEIRPAERFQSVAEFRQALSDPDFRYVSAASSGPAAVAAEGPTQSPTQAAGTTPAPAETVRRPRSWQSVVGGFLLAAFCLVMAAYLAFGLAWVLIGPFALNNRALEFLNLATVPPRRVAQVTPRTPLPSSTAYRTPTPTFTPTRTAPPTATALPATPTATPVLQVVSAANAVGWREFTAWEAPGVEALEVLAALSPDGQSAAVYAPDLQSVRLVDALTGAPQREDLGSFIVNVGRPLDLAFNGQQVLVLLSDQIMALDVTSRAGERLTFFQAPARQMRLSPDGQWVAVRAAYLTLYNLRTKRLYNLGDQGADQAYAFSPDGRYVALAVGTDVELYNLATGGLSRRLAGRNKAIRGLAFTADSARLVATSGDVWDAATGARLATFDSAADLEQVAVSPTGEVVVGSDGDVWAWPAGSARLPLVGRAALPDGVGQGRMEFVAGGQMLWTHVPGRPVTLFAVDPNARQASGEATPAPALTPDRDVIGLLNVVRLAQLEVLSQGQGGLDVSPSGARVLLWSGGQLVVRDVVRNQVLAQISTSVVQDAAFLGEDYVLVVVGAGGGARQVQRWELGTQILRQTYGPYDEKSQRLAASAPANLFALQGKYIQVVDVDTGDLRFNLGSADSLQPFAFTPDGQYLAIASKSVVSLWSMQDGRQAPGPFGGHGPDVTGLDFTPDGRWLAAASGDVWEVATRRRRAVFDPAPGLALSPDGALAVGADGRLWDAATGQYLGDLGQTARALRFTADGRTLVWQEPGGGARTYGIRPLTAHVRPPADDNPAPDLRPLTADNAAAAAVLGWWGNDPLAQRRLIEDGRPPQAVIFGGQTFKALTVSPDGQTLTALSADGVSLLDPANGARVDHYQIFLNPDTVTEVAYLGADLLLLKDRAGLERWDLARQELTQRYNLQGEGLSVSPDGRWFALRQANNVLVVDAASGLEARRYRVQAGPQEYAFAPDSRQLAVATGVLVELYGLEDGQLISRLRGRAGRPFGLAFAPDGSRLYAASGDVWELATGQPVFEQKLDFAATRLALSADGALLLSDDGAVWDAQAGQRLTTLPDVRAPAVQAFFMPAGRQILWRTAAGQVYVWGVHPPAETPAPVFGPAAITVDNAPLWEITNHLGRGRLLEARWSPGDQYLAVNTTANAVIYAGDALTRVAAYLDATVLAFDPQGRALLGGLDQNLRLVDVATGVVVKDYQRTGIIAAAFSPDGQRLALGGRLTPEARALDGLAVIDPDGLERTFTDGPGGYQRFTGLEFTADGQHLVASFPGVTTRGSIWLWDVANGSQVREPIRGNSLPAALSPDGKYLVYLSGARLVHENLKTGGGPLYINADGTPFLEQSIDIPTKFPLGYTFTAPGRLLVFYRETSRRGGGVGSSAYEWTISAASVDGARARFRNLLSLSGLRGLYLDEYARDREQRTPAFGVGPAQKYFFSLTGDGLVRVWDYAAGQELARSENDLAPALAVNPDGQTLVVPDAAGALEIRSLATGALVRALPGAWYPEALAYSSPSVLLVLQAGRLSVVDVVEGRVLEIYEGDLYAQAPYFTVNADGGLFAQWGRPAGRTVLNLFSLAPNRALFSLGQFPRLDQLRFSPAGRLLAVARGRAVELWDLETRQLARTLAAQGRAVGALAFSPDGARLYAASGEIWDTASGELITPFETAATAVLVSPNGAVLLGADGTLWSAADGLLAGNLAGLRGPAVSYAFTANAEQLVWQTGDGVIEIWSLK